MIGQKNLLDNINLLLSNAHVGFMLLSGESGSGKKTVARHLAHQIGGHIYECGIKIDDIRDLIADANRTTDKIVYIIADADNMSVAAKNALLKLTEEPPKNAYIIMTLEDENNTLDTIRSRALRLQMDKYTPEELIEYAQTVVSYLNPEELDIIANICRTPGEVKGLINVGVIEFWEYVNKVVDNITTVSDANSFRIANKIALKPNSNEYDLKLFWRAFMMLCTEKMTFDLDKKVMYANWIKRTSKALQDLRNKSFNTQMLFDMWIVAIREMGE